MLFFSEKANAKRKLTNARCVLKTVKKLSIFNDSLHDIYRSAVRQFLPVSPASIHRWLKEKFGHGISDHTIAQPDLTDACSECDTLKGTIQSLQARLEMNQIQRDDMKLGRII